MPRAKKHLPLPWLDFKQYSGKKVLVVTAHPDDADWFCGGTCARLAKEGAEVIYVICTDGGGGSMDTNLTRSKLAEIRQKEQRTANEILGVSDTIFLGHPDGGLMHVTELDREIAALIREHKPELFITFDPSWPENVMHPDHRAACMAAVRAVRFAVLPLCFTDEEPAGTHLVNDIIFFRPKKTEIVVNVADFAFKKFEALGAHESQMVHMLDEQAAKIFAWVAKQGDNPLTRTMLYAFSTYFYVERFRRFQQMELLR